MTRAAAVAVLLMTSAACIPEEGPMMKPGSDCLECHGGGEEDARRWTVAGTWSGQGRQVSIVDAAGKSFSRHTNQVGNFWTSEPVTFPLRVSVDGVAMPNAVNAADASCNRCHGDGPGSGGGN
jgi:hypothetical protein